MKKILLFVFVLFAPTAFAASIPLPPNQGGTGQSGVPIFGQVLVGNSSGTLILMATSSLGLPAGTVTSVAASGGATGLIFSGSPCSVACSLSLSGTLAVATGGTGNTAFSTNTILYFDGTKIASTSSTPLYVSSLVSTSSTLNSAFFGPMGVGQDASNVNALFELTHNTANKYDPLANTALQTNYALSLHNLNFVNGSSTGVCFAVTNAYGNCGAGIIFTRTNSQSKGSLSFWNKQNTTPGGTLTQGLTLSDSGLFGVGTITPAFALDVYGGTTRNSSNGNDSSFVFARNDGKAGILAAGVSGAGFNFDSTGKFAIGSSPRSTINSGVYSGTDMLTILSSGNTGIGSTSPFARLSVASTAGTDPFAVATSSSATLVFGIDQDGHLYSAGPAPAVSSCGTGSGSVVGDDQSGTITTATAATACTVTFSHSYAATPVCTVSDNSLVGFADISSISASAVTFGISSALTGGNLYYACSYHHS